MSVHAPQRPTLDAIQNLLQQDRFAEALKLLYRHYLPSEDFTVNVLYADALKGNGQPEAALPVYQKAALQGGQYSVALWRRVFECCFATQDIDKATTMIRHALSLEPGNLELHQIAAQLLFSSTLHFQASCHARHILDKSEDDVLLALAENIFRFSMQPYEAYQVVKKRQACGRDPNVFLGLVLCGAQGILEWPTVARCAHTLDTEYYAKGDFTSSREIPLYNIARIADEAINLGVARAATQHLETVEPAFDWRKQPKRGDTEKIRVGLLSADFSAHPVIQLIIGLFETMDKSRFELFAFDDGKNDPSGETRMIEAMDHHIDIREQPHMAVAQRIFDEGIDILIDLMGLTTKNRQEVLALRPCPVTAVFLGFPGTCGLSKIDYVITDATVTPDSSKPWYAEKLCRLPEVFMPNDAKRPIASNPVSRADVGLPDDAVVFCSFNRSFKLDEESVNLWMRILARVPGSVLWQKADDPHMKRVFVETAAQHGVSAERIVFAGNTSSVALHLARTGLADLALDTLIYNGHTITSDMLWAGVPVITCKGKHFASRVSASLLHAVGLDECVTHSPREMEDLAVALATNPARRLALRQRLARQKTYQPLYDTERYTRHFETALTMMLDRALQGLAPDHLDVPALPPRCPAGADPEAHAFLPDGPPRIQEERAGIPEEGAYADMAVHQTMQKTPYAIHFGFCPLCGGRSPSSGVPVSIAAHPLWREPLPEKIFWITCPSCGHLHTNAFWDDTALAILRASDVSLDPEDFLKRRRGLTPAVEYVWNSLGGASLRGAMPSWLVVDARDAALALTLSTFGFVCNMLTVLPGLRDALATLNINIWYNDFVATDVNGACDVITLDALECRPYPRLVLSRAHALLQRGGLLHVPIKNFDSLAWRLMGLNEHNAFLQDPRHLHMFGRGEMTRLLDESGFELEKVLLDDDSVVGLHLIARKR